MFRKFKWSFWIGLLFSIVGVLGMSYAWYYYHQTKKVAYVTAYIPAGQVLDASKNITYRDTGINDLPKGYLSKEELDSQKWRAIDGISVTDPITINKVTNKPLLEIKPDQVIVSYPFANTGLLTFIIPGDQISIIDGTFTLANVLVIGKADKDGNLISLLPSLQGSVRNEAEGLLASSLNNTTPTSSTTSLLLLVNDKDASTLQKMAKPIPILQRGVKL